MSELIHPAHSLLGELDGFRVEVDAARERADIILDRPPFNIISMKQRAFMVSAWQHCLRMRSHCDCLA